MKYNESTESLSSSSLSSSCSEGKINHVISQPKYKSSSLSSSCSEGNVISRAINEPNYKSSMACAEAKGSSEEHNSSEDDGSPSSVNTSNFKEDKEKQQFVKEKKSSQKGAPCMLARKDSGQLLKGEWPEATSVDGAYNSGEAASAKGPSDKIKAWVAKQAGGGLRVKEESKNPLDKEVSNLLLQMLQEHSPPAPTMPQQTTRGLRHEPMTLVKSNSVSATRADNILKLDYLCSSAGSNIPTSHNKLGHRLSTGDSPLYVQKRYGSQGPVSLRTGFPSPGTPSRSSFSGVPTAMMNINNKAYMVGRVAVNEGNGKLLPLYNLPPSSDQETINPGRLSVGFSSRAAPPPSKWDDAGKWLVNASPSHPSQLPPHPSKQANYLNYTESKKNPINNKKVINVVASSSPPFSSHMPGYNTLHTPMDTSMQYQSRSLVPFASPSASDCQMQEELAETMSDSELSNTQEECKVFERSTSHKQFMKESANYAGKQRNSKSQLARKNVLVNNNKQEQLHHVSSPVNLQLKLGSTTTTNTHLEQLPQMHDVYAVECADGAPCGSDEVVGGSGGLARLVMQAGKVVGKWGSGAMRDASTDVSPKLSMSRRDMGTQMTPVASSKTSRSATPLKNSSPVRHNTPTRAKQATVSAHSPARGKAHSPLESSSASPHHLALQNCHLEKLENSHVMRQAGSDSSTTSLSTTSHETSSSSWKSLQDNIASDHHIHRKDQSSSAQVASKMQESSAAAAQYTAWEEAERSKHMTKCAREEARVDAWESHQKAKAEAELKKLEMKLERLRAQATEKIMNKVAIAHLRAEEMRAAARAQQAEQLAKSLERANSISRKGGGYFQESLGVCFSILP